MPCASSVGWNQINSGDMSRVWMGDDGGRAGGAQGAAIVERGRGDVAGSRAAQRSLRIEGEVTRAWVYLVRLALDAKSGSGQGANGTGHSVVLATTANGVVDSSMVSRNAISAVTSAWVGGFGAPAVRCVVKRAPSASASVFAAPL